MEKFPKQENASASNQEQVKFPDISLELEKMIKEDQDIREVSSGGDEDKEHELAEKMGEIDKKNAERLKEIVAQIGWPSISKVGKEASPAAWLLVQHADHDIEFQKVCLDFMKDESKGEVDLHDIAYLEDRIRVNEEKPQLYGTQFNTVEGKFVPKEIEDAENVDSRRKEMGLPTLEENIEEMYRKYNIPKPD